MDFLNRIFLFFASIEGELFYNAHYLVAVVIVLYMLTYEYLSTKKNETLYLIIAFSLMFFRLIFLHMLLLRAHFFAVTHNKPFFLFIDYQLNTLSFIFLAWAFIYPQAKEKLWFQRYFFINIFLLILYPIMHFLWISGYLFKDLGIKLLGPENNFYIIDDYIYNIWQFIIIVFTIFYLHLRPGKSQNLLIKTFFGLLLTIQLAHLLNLSIGQGKISLLINIERVLPILASFSLVLAIYHNILSNLNQTQQKIEQLNLELEKKIEERTQELEKRNKELARAEHMASLGRVAAGLAHEVKNPLNSIEINLGLIKRYLSKSNINEKYEMLDILKLINGELNRLDFLIQEFLMFARPQKIKSAERDVKQFIQQILNLVKAESIKKNINIGTEFPDEKITASFDEALIKQVFLNIIINAFQSMGKGGKLNITIETVNNNIYFHISDTGCGIKKEILSQIFEPFFTTKDDGTGLGLSIAQRIIEEHGGTINVESTPGKGTEFIIQLSK